MASLMRFGLVGISLIVLTVVTAHCGNNLDQQKRLYNCGPQYTYTSAGCVKDTLYCTPKCLTDERCDIVDGKPKCVIRVEQKNQQPIECTIACQPGETCVGGKCVTVPCKPECKSGFICSRGACVLREECNPPCPQFGFVCVEGLCEKICVPSCGTGKQCVQGICEIVCDPACGQGFFCRQGKCEKLEDADGDKFPADRDCNDKDKTIYPGAPEICDGKDNNCDGRVDNIEDKPCYTGSSGSLGKGSCQAGITACDEKKQICKNEVVPKTESCNGKDDDCDGVIDNCPGGGVCVAGKCPGTPEPPAPEKNAEKAPVDGGNKD